MYKTWYILVEKGKIEALLGGKICTLAMKNVTVFEVNFDSVEDAIFYVTSTPVVYFDQHTGALDTFHRSNTCF